MDKNHFKQSPYYPPRTNFWSPFKYIFYDLKESFREWNYRLAVKEYANRISLLPLLIPGFGFLYKGKPRIGRLSLILYFISLVFFIMMLGFKEANYALAFMVFLHSLNIIFYLLGFLRTLNLKTQILFNIAISIGIVPGVYYLLMNFVNNNLIIPIKYKSTTLVGIKSGHPNKTLPGNLIIFEMEGWNSSWEGIRVIGGLNIGRVIAKGGEKVIFNNKLVITKHGTFAKPTHYPVLSELTVPSNSVFVLTEMRMQGNLPSTIQQQIENLIIRQSIIGIDEYKGYIPKTWFGRIQYY